MRDRTDNIYGIHDVYLCFGARKTQIPDIICVRDLHHSEIKFSVRHTHLSNLTGATIMPPRFPHRLVNPPTQMSIPELAVLGILGVSVTFGVVQMCSDAFKLFRQRANESYSPGSEPRNQNFLSTACPMKSWKRDN